jgi:hypothetical protein
LSNTPATTPTAKVGLFRKIENWASALWKKEEPTIEQILENVAKAAEPLYKTALGKLAQTTVTGLTAYAAAGGGVAAAGKAASTILEGAKTEGITLANSTVNLITELTVAKVKAEAAALGATVPTIPATPVAPDTPSTTGS